MQRSFSIGILGTGKSVQYRCGPAAVMQRMPQETAHSRKDVCGLSHWETGKVRRTMMQSRKTY